MQASECRALITGASGGIGLPVATALCRLGARVLLVGRRTEPLHETARTFPGQVEVVQADMTERTGREAVASAAEDFGGLNCLINGAGINSFGLLEHQDEDTIAALIGLNVTSTLQLTHRLLPTLRSADRAFVVNIGSTFGSIGYPGFSTYCASKFALRGFSEALRRELADTRIKVIYIAPRATRTALNSPSVVAMNRDLKVTMDPPERVAAAVLAAVHTEREETYLGWPEKFFVSLNGLLPRIVDRALRKQLPTIRRFAETRN
ncbi:MAG TPA: SDR family oxidoreductase [Rhodocyclaceae bacterium]|nr:SDR family oxidoreductase [Rhodocyclaceae bacterium]